MTGATRQDYIDFCNQEEPTLTADELAIVDGIFDEEIVELCYQYWRQGITWDGISEASENIDDVDKIKPELMKRKIRDWA